MLDMSKGDDLVTVSRKVERAHRTVKKWHHEYTTGSRYTYHSPEKTIISTGVGRHQSEEGTTNKTDT